MAQINEQLAAPGEVQKWFDRAIRVRQKKPRILGLIKRLEFSLTDQIANHEEKGNASVAEPTFTTFECDSPA